MYCLFYEHHNSTVLMEGRKFWFADKKSYSLSEFLLTFYNFKNGMFIIFQYKDTMKIEVRQVIHMKVLSIS